MAKRLFDELDERNRVVGASDQAGLRALRSAGQRPRAPLPQGRPLDPAGDIQQTLSKITGIGAQPTIRRGGVVPLRDGPTEQLADTSIPGAGAVNAAPAPTLRSRFDAVRSFTDGKGFAGPTMPRGSSGPSMTERFNAMSAGRAATEQGLRREQLRDFARDDLRRPSYAPVVGPSGNVLDSAFSGVVDPNATKAKQAGAAAVLEDIADQETREAGERIAETTAGGRAAAAAARAGLRRGGGGLKLTDLLAAGNLGLQRQKMQREDFNKTLESMHPTNIGDDETKQANLAKQNFMRSYFERSGQQFTPDALTEAKDVLGLNQKMATWAKANASILPAWIASYYTGKGEPAADADTALAELGGALEAYQKGQTDGTFKFRGQDIPISQPFFNGLLEHFDDAELKRIQSLNRKRARAVTGNELPPEFQDLTTLIPLLQLLNGGAETEDELE